MTGSSKQTTTTTNNAPWSGAQPALNTALSGAQNLYNSGVGSQVYTGQTYATPSDQSRDAALATQGFAYNNIGGRGLSGQYQDIINNGGYNPATAQATQNIGNVANANWSLSPELQKIIDQTNADTNNAVSLNNSAAGRYGSGLGNSAVADAISKNTNNLLYTDLNNFNTRKDAANSNLFNMGQSAIGNLGTAYAGMSAPTNDLAKAGGYFDNLATQQLNDQLRIFDAQQNKPWENLARLNAIASGAGQLGGTSTQSQPGQNPLLTALGYGTTGAGLLGSFF
ncbi:hypothetical protein IB244_30895 [Rhizobium sp. RHZ02]|uniref:hypothetical protein n=1 Tax=Rhizobium sp. RHZ02 TaxID=2769306 RepID=UPI001780499F|nr:hypothetical protein [Rhizobium sp. RHZ02]MBD9455885.1 hypothetical protein [Rhizobium sp. RHZ02]